MAEDLPAGTTGGLVPAERSLHESRYLARRIRDGDRQTRKTYNGHEPWRAQRLPFGATHSTR